MQLENSVFKTFLLHLLQIPVTTTDVVTPSLALIYYSWQNVLAICGAE